jgi:branched-chain amino acid transport system ATP-binding protein
MSAPAIDAPLLRVRDLEVVYRRTTVALHGVNLDIPAGAIVAVMGGNGAGKSTLLRSISGFIGLDAARIARGSVCFMGEAIENLPPHRIAQRGIAIVPERDKIFPNLSIAENLAVVQSATSGSQARQRLEAQVYEYFPRLADMRKREAGLLSGGERQMLAIGAALVSSPRLLLVDELSLGLAPVVVQDLAQRLIQIRRDLGITMIVVEQSAALALAFADHGVVLENGCIALEGSAAELRGNERIQELYLGGKSGNRRNYRDARTRTEPVAHG